MNELPGLIKDLALISIYAAIVLLIFKKIKQPVVLGYILAGMLVGPHIPFLPTINDMENIHVWANIGVIFLLFSLGLEFSFKKIVNVGKSALITATANILFLLFVGYQVGLILGWNTTDSLFLGGMISMSSTTIIIKAFDELTQKSKPIKGDILLTKDGTLGRVALVEHEDICVNQSVAVLRCNVRVLPAFLFYLLQMPEYQREMISNAGGGTIKHIYITKVDKMLVGVPELSIQSAFLFFANRAEKNKAIISNSLGKLETLKKALMQEYFG